MENGVKGKRDQMVIYVSQAIRGPVGLWPEPVSCQAKCWLMPGDPSPSWNYKFTDAYILQILQIEKANPNPTTARLSYKESFGGSARFYPGTKRRGEGALGWVKTWQFHNTSQSAAIIILS